MLQKVDLKCCICCNEKVHMLQRLCFKCSRCLHMFKMFHLVFSKVNLGVAHVAMAIHACFKSFIFQTYVANASSGCCNSRSCVAYVVMAIHACFKCFICFRRMLKVFHLDVSKGDLRRAHIAMVAVAGGQRLATSACYCC
jgi:hypothetical protein